MLKNSEIEAKLPELTQQYLHTTVSDFSFIGGGSYGKVFKGYLSDSSPIIFKAYRKRGMEASEANQLKILSANTRVKMPEVFFTHSDENISLLAMSCIEGQNVLSPSFLLKSNAQKQAFARDVVAGMLDFHSVKNEKYGELEDPQYDSWLEFYRETMVNPRLTGLQKLCENGKYSKKNLALLNKATELFFGIADEPESPVLIHGDLNIMNIMADPKTMMLQGFIDPCGTMWADREYDLFQLQSMWGNSFGLYEAYKSRYKVSEHCDFKVAYYGALHEASMRLSGGLIFPIWEVLCNNRLKKAMKKYYKQLNC